MGDGDGVGLGVVADGVYAGNLIAADSVYFQLLCCGFSTLCGASVGVYEVAHSPFALSVKLGTIADKADDVMGGVSSVVTTLDESDLAGVITSLKALLENINDPDGTVGKLLVDGSVYDSVDELLNDIDTLVKKIEENPKKYIKISVF